MGAKNHVVVLPDADRYCEITRIKSNRVVPEKESGGGISP